MTFCKCIDVIETLNNKIMKKLKPLYILLVLISSQVLTNCSSSEDDPNNNPPSIFSANTIDVGFDYATIEWTESLDSDDDPVTYAIIFEGQEVASDLTALTFSFFQLESDTSYTGYVESSDGRGGTNRADFFFTTDPEVIITQIIVKEFERATTNACTGVTTSLEIDAGVLVKKYIGNVTYTVSFGTLTLNNGNSTIAAMTRTWTNDNLNSYYIYDYDAKNYFVWQAGAGFACSNNPNIDDTRAFYASASGEVTITLNRN